MYWPGSSDHWFFVETKSRFTWDLSSAEAVHFLEFTESLDGLDPLLIGTLTDFGSQFVWIFSLHEGLLLWWFHLPHHDSGLQRRTKQFFIKVLLDTEFVHTKSDNIQLGELRVSV